MRISAKADYAVRAVLELAAADRGPVKGERIAEAQQIPLKFLENILAELRHAGIVASQRGADGGYWLARPPEQISIAEILRTVEGPLAHIRGARPEKVAYRGSAKHLVGVWVGVRASLRSVLEQVTVAHVLSGSLPESVRELVDLPGSWVSH